MAGEGDEFGAPVPWARQGCEHPTNDQGRPRDASGLESLLYVSTQGRQQGLGTRVGFFLSTLMSSESETCLISFKVFFFLFYSSNFTHLILRFTTSGTTMVSKIPDYSDSPPLLSLYKLPACCFACCFGTRTLLDSDNFCVCLLIYFLDGCIFLSLLFLLYLLDWNIKFVHIW